MLNFDRAPVSSLGVDIRSGLNTVLNARNYENYLALYLSHACSFSSSVIFLDSVLELLDPHEKKFIIINGISRISSLRSLNPWRRQWASRKLQINSTNLFNCWWPFERSWEPFKFEKCKSSKFKDGNKVYSNLKVFSDLDLTQEL